MKKVEMIKLRDTAELQLRVDELKQEEYSACEALNKEYLQCEEREQHLIAKTKRKRQLMMAIIAQWECNKTK
jgi:hypothetical protein